MKKMSEMKSLKKNFNLINKFYVSSVLYFKEEKKATLNLLMRISESFSNFV